MKLIIPQILRIPFRRSFDQADAAVWILLSLSFLFVSSHQARSQTGVAYTFTTFAGTAGVGSEDGAGSAARFRTPFGIAADTNNNLYVADSFNYTIRKITPAGVVTTIAGLAQSQGLEDGTNGGARFMQPMGIATDNAGHLYATDGVGNTIRQLTQSGTNWIVTTIAGTPGISGKVDGTNKTAQFSFPKQIAIDRSTNLYVTDSGNSTIRKLTLTGTNWVVTTIAGAAGTNGFNDGSNSLARFDNPYGIAVANPTNLFVADQNNSTIRKLMAAGTNWVVQTIVGLAKMNGSADGTNAVARFFLPSGIGLDAAGGIYVADFNNSTIRKITPQGTNWITTTLAGLAQVYGSGDGTGTNATFNLPSAVAIDAGGNLYVTDAGNNSIRKVTSAGVTSTLAGTAASRGSTDGTGGGARFYLPYGLAIDNSDNLYVADSGNHTIRKTTSAGVVSTVAGLPGSAGSSNGAGGNARFDAPAGLTVDKAGNVFVADTTNCVIRRITPAGVVSNIAGLTGISGSANGSNSVARFSFPRGIGVDGATNLYVADTLNSTIRRAVLIGTDWAVTTIAGSAGNPGPTDGTNAAARFNQPASLVVDSGTNIYVADTGNNTIRKISPSGANWVVSTICGLAGVSGIADGSNNIARFFRPEGIALDAAGNLYVSDTTNNTVRKIMPSGTNWVVNTIAGVGGIHGSADGTGGDALFQEPRGIAVDSSGGVFVADSHNNTIRKGTFTQYASPSLVAYAPSQTNGGLVVTLTPPEANGGWRFPWELSWRQSGQVATNLVPGDYPIEFRDVPGFLILPLTGPIAVTDNGVAPVSGVYYPTISPNDPNSASGSLTVNLGPNPPPGAGWRFLGDTSAFLSSGYSTNLLPGIYLIEFAAVTNRSTPRSAAIEIVSGSPAFLSVNYLVSLREPSGVSLPVAVPIANINDVTNFPFGFNGQLQTDAGLGSGVAVQPQVVLTAAHLVFNDQTLSYVRQLYWIFRQDQPQAARAIYVLSGYAAQRTNDLNIYAPDVSTPQSRNLDVAALYFQYQVAGGGHGGFLPSDAVPNPWLTGSNLKMLVGFPVDGSLFGDNSIIAGRMYQTLPRSDGLTQATDPVPNQQVYIAPWFLSYPGNSGGPLYSQLNGYYYPAGVYLGTLYNGAQPYASLVRAIDSNVVSLITQAATLGDVSTNNTSGGVIRIFPGAGINSTNPGYVQWQLGPRDAVKAGAAWRLAGDATYSSETNYVRAVTTTNVLTIEFKDLPGWNGPTNKSVVVFPGQRTNSAAFYSVTNPVLYFDPIKGLRITGTTGTTYRLDRLVNFNSNKTSNSWIAVVTKTLTNGFNPLLPWPPTNGPASFYRAVWLP